MRYGRPKYRNVKTTVDGITFDSKRESVRYCELKLLAKARKITNLRLQVPYVMRVNGEKICKYVADFVYCEDGNEIVEDVKGMRTREYILKRKLMKAVYGIEIRETK